MAHLRAMVAWADGLPLDLGPLGAPDQERSRVEAALARAHRVLADRDDPDKGDQVRRGSRRPAVARMGPMLMAIGST